MVLWFWECLGNSTTEMAKMPISTLCDRTHRYIRGSELSIWITNLYETADMRIISLCSHVGTSLCFFWKIMWSPLIIHVIWRGSEDTRSKFLRYVYRNAVVFIRRRFAYLLAFLNLAKYILNLNWTDGKGLCWFSICIYSLRKSAGDLWPLLLTWFKLNPSMDN